MAQVSVIRLITLLALAKFFKREKKRKEKTSVDRLQIPAQTEVIFLVRVSYVFRNLYLTTKGEKFSRLTNK